MAVTHEMPSGDDPKRANSFEMMSGVGATFILMLNMGLNVVLCICFVLVAMAALPIACVAAIFGPNSFGANVSTFMHPLIQRMKSIAESLQMRD